MLEGPPIQVPWWWAAIERDLEPSLIARSQELGCSVETTTKRVFAALRLMIQPRHSIDPFRALFPEISLSNVDHWKEHEVFISALRDTPESALVGAALERLGFLGRNAPELPLPRGDQPSESEPTDWRRVFSRSSLGRDVVFVRGTHRSHSGAKSLKRREHKYFSAILGISDRYDLVRSSFWTGAPCHASTYEDYAAFLDGGFMSKAGDYLIGLHGTWVIGHAALRFLCFELGLSPPPWPLVSERPPTRRDLGRQILIQLSTEVTKLRQRIREYERR